jgi:anti-sigma factor RsiW
MMDLMAYADGELGEVERLRVEAFIASNEDAQRVVRSMGVVGQWGREGYRAPDSPSIVDDVMRRVDEDKLVDLAAVRRRRWWMGGAAAAVAAAAAWLVVARHPGERAPIAQNLPETPSSAPAQAGPSNSGGVDVEQVESPAHPVAVFYVPALAASASVNASTVVVWITEEEKGP